MKYINKLNLDDEMFTEKEKKKLEKNYEKDIKKDNQIITK